MPYINPSNGIESAKNLPSPAMQILITIASAQAARSVVVSAADRQVWFPGNDPAPHLDGSMPGDYGFDPLSLGSDPKILKWYAVTYCPKCGRRPSHDIQRHNPAVIAVYPGVVNPYKVFQGNIYLRDGGCLRRNLHMQVPAGRACACKDSHDSSCRHHLPCSASSTLSCFPPQCTDAQFMLCSAMLSAHI